MKAEYIDHGGTDLSVVNAARVSFDSLSDWEEYEYLDPFFVNYEGAPMVLKGKRLKAKDVNLINYLARGMPSSDWVATINEIIDFSNDLVTQEENFRNVERVVKGLIDMAQHWAPFTHNWIELRMEAPVPIRTQAFKHKVGFTESEESRRYIKSTPSIYMPTFRSAADNVKQGSAGEHPKNLTLQAMYEASINKAVNTYLWMTEDMGVAPETARFVLPQGAEVQWIWSGNLASYARYYNQRTDPHAQQESRDLAEMVGAIIEPLFPVSWKALTGG